MKTDILGRAAVIGIVCGLRSMTGPAVVRWRSGDPLRLAFAAAAAGEIVVDKLPIAPPRTIPPSVAFRALSGAWCGAGVAGLFEGDRAGAAIAGALGAVAASYGAMALRQAIDRATGIADPVVALVEDALAIYGAMAATA